MGKLINHPLITDTLFYPSRISPADVPSDADGGVVMIPVGSDELGAYYHHPLPGSPTVLFFHGNGEVMTDYLYDYHRRIESAGFNFMVVDYRGYGLSSGSPNLSRLLEDAAAAWAHATGEMGIAAEDMVVMGRSLGSLAALEIVSGPGRDARALVIESGIGRFDGWMDRMGPLLERLGLDVAALKRALLESFDHKSKLARFSGPVLIMHSPHDQIVPMQHAKDLASWGDPSRTTLHVFPEGGHNDIQLVNRDDYFRVLSDFLGGRPR